MALRAAAVVAVAVVGVGALARGGSDRDAVDGAPTGPAAVEDAAVVPPVLPSPGAVVGRQFAAEAATLWERTDLPPTGSSAVVVPAGDRHVLVGGRLLDTTAADNAGVGLRALPEPIASSAIASDGSWAIAELGRLVVGRTSEPSSRSITVDEAWTPSGAAVAWRDGEPVLRGTDQHLARVRLDGTIRWRTAEPLLAVGTVGQRWLAAQSADGTVAAVSLDDGRMAPLAELPVALHGDIAIIASDDIVARDLATGEVLWRRPADRSTWRTVGDHLVAVDLGEVVRVDPRTGTEQGRVTGREPVATAAAAVVVDSDRLQAMGWDGTTAWAVSLEAGARHVLAPVDAARVAVTSATEGGTQVTILRATDGAVLATSPAPAAGGGALLAEDDVVAVMSSGETVLTVDAATGTDVDVVVPPASPEDFGFVSGETAVTVTAASTTLRGTSAGAEVWSLVLQAPLAVAPIRSGPTVVVGLVDGSVAAIGGLRGEPRWQQDLDVLPTALAGDGTVLLVGTADGRVLRLDPEGRTVTSTDLGEGAVLSLVARPAIALLDDRLVGLDVAG